jgi:hypothetical protein
MSEEIKSLEDQLEDQQPEKLDKTRVDRLNLMGRVDEFLAKAEKGKRFDRKDMLLVIKELASLCAHHEGLIQAVISDMVSVVKRIEIMNINTIQFNVGLTATKMLLEEKGVFTEAELEVMWKKIVVDIMETKKAEAEADRRIITPDEFARS